MKINKMLLVSSLIIFWASCRKPMNENNVAPVPKTAMAMTTAVTYERVATPTAISNIKRAIAAAANDADRDLVQAIPLDDVNHYMYYVKINYANLQPDVAKTIVDDTSTIIFDYPIDNKALYNPKQIGTENTSNQLKDGFGYAVISAQNSILRSLDYQIIDTFINPAIISEEAIMILEEEANKINRFPVENTTPRENGIAQRVRLVKFPQGHIKYFNTELGFVPVRDVAVWAIWNGIPVRAYTNTNGYFRINYPYFFTGTLFALKYNTPRYKMLPFDHRGNNFADFALAIAGIVAGAVSDQGWISRANLENVQINLDRPNSPNAWYWSHIANAISYHDMYCAQEQIFKAPSYLNIWAVRKNNYKDQTNNGTGNTLMTNYLGPLSNLSSQIDNELYDHFGTTNVSGFIQLFNISKSVFPDQRYYVGDLENYKFSSRFTKVALHELSHASHFGKMGRDFWVRLGYTQHLYRNDPGYGPAPAYEENVWKFRYSSITNTYSSVFYPYYQHAAGVSQLEEAWCEFLAQDFARRIFNPNVAGSASREYKDLYGDNDIKPFALLKEKERYFVSKWIPKGAFNDFMDAADPVNEPWDNISGFSIKQLWDVFDPTIETDYHYRKKMVQMYPWLTEQAIFDVFLGNKL